MSEGIYSEPIDGYHYWNVHSQDTMANYFIITRTKIWWKWPVTKTRNQILNWYILFVYFVTHATSCLWLYHYLLFITFFDLIIDGFACCTPQLIRLFFNSELHTLRTDNVRLSRTFANNWWRQHINISERW